MGARRRGQHLNIGDDGHTQRRLPYGRLAGKCLLLNRGHMTVRRYVPAAILRWISRITRRGKSNDKNLDALLTALYPGNESPAQQPGFFSADLMRKDQRGLAGIDVRSWHF